MAFFDKYLKDTATYWVLSDSTDAFGEPTYATPVTRNVRWEDSIELFLNPAGEEEASSAVIYTSGTVQEAGYLFLGTSVAADPKTVDGAKIIHKVESVSDLKDRITLKRVFL